MSDIPRLEPLKQWICDTCEQVISRPQDGELLIIRDETSRRITDYKITHSGKCTRGIQEWQHLRDVTGPDGLVAMISDIDNKYGIVGDVGGNHYFEPDRLHVWAETVRRLHVPHYEEARFFISDESRADGIGVFMQESLLRRIEERKRED